MDMQASSTTTTTTTTAPPPSTSTSPSSSPLSNAAVKRSGGTTRRRAKRSSRAFQYVPLSGASTAMTVMMSSPGQSSTARTTAGVTAAAIKTEKKAMRDDAEKENVDPETGLRSGGGGGGGMTSGNVFGAVRVEDVEAFQSAVKKVSLREAVTKKAVQRQKTFHESETNLIDFGADDDDDDDENAYGSCMQKCNTLQASMNNLKLGGGGGSGSMGPRQHRTPSFGGPRQPLSTINTNTLRSNASMNNALGDKVMAKSSSKNAALDAIISPFGIFADDALMKNQLKPPQAAPQQLASMKAVRMR